MFCIWKIVSINLMNLTFSIGKIVIIKTYSQNFISHCILSTEMFPRAGMQSSCLWLVLYFTEKITAILNFEIDLIILHTHPDSRVNFLKLALNHCACRPTFWLLFQMKKLSSRKSCWCSNFSLEKSSQIVERRCNSWAQVSRNWP